MMQYMKDLSLQDAYKLEIRGCNVFLKTLIDSGLNNTIYKGYIQNNLRFMELTSSCS